MHYSTLITTDQLRAGLGAGTWRVLDCRYDLMNPSAGAQQYAQGHIPGALYADMEHDLSGARNGRNGRHPLPDPARFMDWLGSRGVAPDTQVVVYDAGGGTSAARLWWLLRWVGHRAVALLDGGWAAWLDAGGASESAVPNVAPSHYPARADAACSADVDAVARNIGSDGLLLIDARTRSRFLGENEPIDPVAGRIPGSVNRFCGENLDTRGRFKPAAALRAEFDAVLGDRAPSSVVHTCGSGVAACHNALAMEIAGLPGSRVYTGSWSEWIADPHRPRAVGQP